MKKIQLLTVAISFALLTGACDKWFDGALPIDKNLEPKQYASELDINAVLNGVYQSMASETLYGLHLTHTTTELLAHYYYYPSSLATEPGYINYYMVSEYYYSTIATTLSSMWKDAYSLIFKINNFIYNVESTTVVSEQKKNILMGEAFGLRAFLHLDMMRMFGDQDLPYNQDYEVTSHPMLNRDAFFELLLADIDKADSLLQLSDPLWAPGAKILGDGTEGMQGVPTSDVFYKYFRNYRLNVYAVQALKARALMYRNNAGDKAQAAEIAQQILDRAFGSNKPFEYYDTSSKEQYFGGNDYIFYPEVIFGIYNLDLPENWKDQTEGRVAGSVLAVDEVNLRSNIFGNDPQGGDISTWADVRSRQWTKSNLTADKYISNKYKEETHTLPYYSYQVDVIKYYQPLIRTAELRYIVIENLIDEGKYDDAVQILADFLLHRGWKQQDIDNYLSGSITEDYLNSLLETEYYKEFYAEGQTFFFLKRRKSATIFDAAQAGKVPLRSDAFNVPLPDDEINYY
ncbi:MAG: RagB/SusD family nutrient uptake outer membrane protein [Candidatus Symbiothrix sp.]|jgi:hypothetical protein|nr:RagB/SusD family nutrient uptake outer membrane protein [Candidatus Symbiothrix sp.]